MQGGSWKKLASRWLRINVVRQQSGIRVSFSVQVGLMIVCDGVNPLGPQDFSRSVAEKINGISGFPRGLQKPVQGSRSCLFDPPFLSYSLQLTSFIIREMEDLLNSPFSFARLPEWPDEGERAFRLQRRTAN